MTTDMEILTLFDYAALDETEDEFVTELVRGAVVREPRPHRVHGRVQVKLAARLERWAEARRAEVTVESGYVLSEEPPTVRGPDVAVVVDPSPTESEPGGWTRGAPDVAVEVLSPSDRSNAIHRKTLEYLEAGARLVWIVDPAARTILVHRPDGSANLLKEVETLSGEEVLAEFSLALSEVFE